MKADNVETILFVGFFVSMLFLTTIYSRLLDKIAKDQPYKDPRFWSSLFPNYLALEFWIVLIFYEIYKSKSPFGVLIFSMCLTILFHLPLLRYLTSKIRLRIAKRFGRLAIYEIVHGDFTRAGVDDFKGDYCDMYFFDLKGINPYTNIEETIKSQKIFEPFEDTDYSYKKVKVCFLSDKNYIMDQSSIPELNNIPNV